MPKVVKSTIMDAPIETVWDVLRDFNGHESWHPAVKDSQIERGYPADKVGCVRRFHLADGSELREQLLTLSDLETCFSYCLLDTPGTALQLRRPCAPASGDRHRSHLLAMGKPLRHARGRGRTNGASRR